ncbi:MAG: hypothetical protein WCE46_02515 [Methanoregula sp.]|uniref:hypothetical protein n=1 Tax=Methanoregula sp. TaxID=2052170 RepID=UPI003C7895B7
MNTMETSEQNGSPLPRLEAKGTGTATQVSRSDLKISTGSPFMHCGKIEMLQQDLRISYDSFGASHEVFISSEDLGPLVRDRFAPPARVMEIRSAAGGAQERIKIGYAARSVSGKALKISTTTSGGELMAPWSSFLKVVNRKARSVPVSRIAAGAPQVQVPQRPGPSHDIREGLTGGF